MAAPNIVNVTTITGTTAVANVSTTATAIAENTAASGKVFKINSLYVSNLNANTNIAVSIDIFRSSVAYHVVKDVVVPVNASIDAITKPVYLLEGDAFRLTAAANGDIQAVCSYEEIS